MFCTASPVRLNAYTALELLTRKLEDRQGEFPCVSASQQYWRIRAHADAAMGFSRGWKMGLWARLMGFAGREGDFHALTRRALATEGMAGIAPLVGGFNDRACMPTRTAGFRPTVPLRAVVGN